MSATEELLFLKISRYAGDAVDYPRELFDGAADYAGELAKSDRRRLIAGTRYRVPCTQSMNFLHVAEVGVTVEIDDFSG